MRLNQLGLTWKLQSEGSTRVVYLQGVVDERADFTALAQMVTGPVTFDMEQVVRISSFGAQQWIRFISTVDQQGPHTLRRCSPVTVAQLNMLPNFAGGAKVISVMAPFICLETDQEYLEEVPIENGAPKMPAAKNPQTGQDLRFDDTPQRYFSFLSAVVTA